MSVMMFLHLNTCQSKSCFPRCVGTFLEIDFSPASNSRRCQYYTDMIHGIQTFILSRSSERVVHSSVSKSSTKWKKRMAVGWQRNDV